MVVLGRVTCHPARETVVYEESISCHHGSCTSIMSKGGSFWDEMWSIAACVAAFEWFTLRLHTFTADFWFRHRFIGMW